MRIAVEFAYPDNRKIARLTYATHEILDIPVVPLTKASAK